MIDLGSGRIAYAVLSFGGILGMGDKLFAIPWSALTLDTVDHKFILNAGKKSLEAAPGFDKDKAHTIMMQREYTIRIHLGAGSGECLFLTCDLTAEYVSINADYST